MRPLARAAAFLALLASAGRARAEVLKGPQVWPGRHELSVGLGFQFGVSDYGHTLTSTPSGFKVLLDYAYRFHPRAWFDVGVNLVLASGCTRFGGCGYLGSGNTIEPHAGVKLKWTTPIPLVPYALFQAMFIGVYNRYCDDSGFAIAGRFGGGARYFLTKNVGLGLELGFLAGPAFFGGAARCGPYPGHNQLYAAVDLAAGAEFVF